MSFTERIGSGEFCFGEQAVRPSNAQITAKEANEFLKMGFKCETLGETLCETPDKGLPLIGKKG
jgi:hypothetical protein